jgi:periplasmic protein TonB
MNRPEEQEDQTVFQEASRQAAQLTNSSGQDASEIVSESCQPRLVRGRVARISVYSQSRANPETTSRFQASVELIHPSEPRHKAFWTNLKCLVTSGPPTYLGVTATPIPTDLIIEEPPWFRTVLSHLRCILAKSERSGVVHAKASSEIFRDYKFQRSSLLFSGLLHLLALAGLLLLPRLYLQQTNKIKLTVTQVSLLVPSKLILHLPDKPGTSGGGGGGGRRESTPASLGRLPRAADRQLTPPVLKVVNLNPVLPVEPTVIAPELSQLPAVNLPYYGDPFGVPGPPSSGPGTGGGIGSGTGGGVGPGKGGGVGSGEGGGFGGGEFGGRVYRVGGGVTPPTIIYRVEPAYSEEARKARYQGTVVLSAIVRKDGALEVLKVIRGVGLGLDENAIRALKQWKFRPGEKDGNPVDVALYVEVNFSLR